MKYKITEEIKQNLRICFCSNMNVDYISEISGLPKGLIFIYACRKKIKIQKRINKCIATKDEIKYIWRLRRWISKNCKNNNLIKEEK